MIRTRHLFPCATLFLLLPTIGHGEEAAEPSTLPEVVVTATPLEAPFTVPSADAAARALNEVPGATALVPADDYRPQRATTVKDMLDFVPGVFAQPKFGEDSRLSIRGSGLSRNFHLRGIQLLQDGMPINAADGGGDFQEIDPLVFDYVEVFKGANALRYGADTLGGAVNFVTPTGVSRPETLLRMETGSFGFRRVQVATGGTAENWDYFITPTYLASDGFRERTGQESARLSGNLGYAFSDTAETRFYLHLNHIDQELPGSVTRSVALTEPERANAASVANRHKRDIESVRVANRSAVLWGDTRLEFGGSVAAKALWHPIFQVLDNDYWDYTAFVQGEREGRLFGVGAKATGGINFSYGTNRARRYVNAGGRKGALTADADEEASNLAGYAGVLWQLSEGWTLVTGLQLLHAHRETIDNFVDDGLQQGQRHFQTVNPKLGFLWEAAPGVQAFGNVSRSFEPPPLAELSTTTTLLTTLDAQRAWTGEIGTRGRHGPFAWDVTLYRAHLSREFQFFQIAPNQFQVTNADDTIHQGAEIGFTWTMAEGLFRETDRLASRQAYTWSDFFFDGDAVWGDNELPGMPRHYLRSELLYGLGSRFTVSAHLEWVPERYFVDNANTLATQPYVLMGLRAEVTLWDGVRTFLDARNLADHNYIASTSVIAVPTPANQAVFNPGDGRAVYAGIEWRW